MYFGGAAEVRRRGMVVEMHRLQTQEAAGEGMRATEARRRMRYVGQ